MKVSSAIPRLTTFPLILCLLGSLAQAACPDVFISEFMASNDRTLNDEDGDDSDWIEIFNSGSTPTSLNGWFLTDKANNLVKWRFPDVFVSPNGYLVIFASEKDKTNPTGSLHTNFKLSADGEYLALISPTANVISEFAPAYPKQFTDVSYGRTPGMPEVLGYFTQPTPAEPNASGGAGFAPEVHFSNASGTFTTSFNLTLSTSASDSVIRYTLDGHLPTNSSPAYAEPIWIANSVQVRAQAFEDGLLPGPPHSESFLLLSNDVVNFTSDLPVIIIHSLGQPAPTSTNQSSAHISVHEPIGGVTSLTNPATLATRSRIKVRKVTRPKSSFTLEFWDEHNRDKSQEIIGLPPDADWVLYAPQKEDAVLIHNPFIYQLSRDIGRYSPRTRFVEVYFNAGAGPIGMTNYHGIYVLEEKIKIGRHRVDNRQTSAGACPAARSDRRLFAAD